MSKRCNCPDVCAEHPGVSYETLIQKGLICDSCIQKYKEFLQD